MRYGALGSPLSVPDLSVEPDSHGWRGRGRYHRQNGGPFWHSEAIYAYLTVDITIFVATFPINSAPRTSFSTRGPAAIDGEDRAAHRSTGVATQIDGGGGDFLYCDEAAHWLVVVGLFLFEIVLQHLVTRVDFISRNYR